MSEKNDKMFEAYRRYLIPLFAVGEAIASQGRSPGTVALTQEKIFQDQEDRARKYKIEDEERSQKALDRALERKTSETQLKLAEQQLAEKSGQSERQKEYRKGLSDILSGDQGIDFVGPPIPENIKNEKAQKFVESYLQKEDPQKFLELSIKQNQPDFWTKLMATQQGKLNAPQKISQSSIKELSSIREAVQQLDELMKTAPTFTSLTYTPLDKIRVMNPWDKDVLAFNQLIASTKQVIGKGLEGGVLRKEDEYKYSQIIPKLGDTRDVLLAKANQLRAMLENKDSTLLNSFQQGNIETFNLKPIESYIYSIGKNKKQTKDQNSKSEFDDLWGE